MPLYLEQVLPPLVFYLLFNAAFFRYVKRQVESRASGWLLYGAYFGVNFLAYSLFSVWGLNLIVNWSLILVLFALEVRAAFRVPWPQALCYALLAAAVGLAINVFCRSLFAILLDVPQSMFNNDDLQNLRHLPVSIGFALSALAFWLLDRFQAKREMAVVCENRRSLAFFLVMGFVAFGYLCSVLLLYYLPDNALVLKLWGIKASLSAGMIFALAFFFAYRSAFLIRCGEESRRLSTAIAERRKENESLRTLAICDSLTGCYTRAYLDERLKALLAESPVPFGVAFVDVDGLKTVNDTFGHDTGNEYLSTVASILSDFCHDGEGDYLCRYGGDEFVAVFPHRGSLEARARLDEVAHRLRTESESGRFAYPLSVSYGVVEAASHEGYEQMLARADAEMYRNKKRNRSAASGA